MTNNVKPPTTSPSHEARAHVLGAMLGVAITFAAENTVKGGWDLPQIIAFPAFVITAVVFTIAMMQLSRDERYANELAKSENLCLASYDLFSDVLTAVLLVFMAFHLNDTIGLFATNLALRIVDIAVEILVVRRVTGAIVKTDTWILVDSIALGSLLLTAVGLSYFNAWNSSGALAMSMVFFAFTIIDTAIDLANNGPLYFNTAAKPHMKT